MWVLLRVRRLCIAFDQQLARVHASTLAELEYTLNFRQHACTCSAHLADAHEALQHADGGARLAALLRAPLRLVVRQQHLQAATTQHGS